MNDAFGWDRDTYLFYGGYPGAAKLISDEQRWANYIRESLLETSISRDILLMTRVDKPALLRRLFELGCQYSGQILSYQKMLGQLDDAGNTTTLAHYLRLLGSAGFITGLHKYAGQQVRQHASSPKLLCLNTALMSTLSGKTIHAAKNDTQFWGRLFETAVGAHLYNTSRQFGYNLFYWLDRNREVDYVLEKAGSLVAIEVKSGKKRTSLPGLDLFSNNFKVIKKLLIGTGGMPFEEFSRLERKFLFE